MNARLTLVSRLQKNAVNRESYMRGKLGVLISAQLRALRGKYTQAEMSKLLGMKQSRISAMENPGAVNFSLDTLVRAAAALKIAIKVEFCSYSELVHWEASLRPEEKPVCLDDDVAFLTGASGTRFSTFRVSGNLPAGIADKFRPNMHLGGSRWQKSLR